VTQELLILGAETPPLRQVMPILRRVDFQVLRLTREDQALELLQGTHFDLIIARYPMGGLPLEELVQTVRAKESPCRDSGLLVLTHEDSLEEVGGFLRRGVNRIVSVDAPPDRLLDAIADLVGVAPRHSLRTVVQFELWVEQGAQRLHLIEICHVRPVGDGLASGSFDLGDHRFGRRRRPSGSIEVGAEVVDDHPRTSFGQGEGVGSSQPGSGSGHNGNSLVETDHVGTSVGGLSCRQRERSSESRRNAAVIERRSTNPG